MYFCRNKKQTVMTALELNAQIYQSLGLLATDEHYLKKAADYLKKLVKKKSEEKNSIDEALDDIKNGRVIQYNSLDELIKDI